MKLLVMEDILHQFIFHIEEEFKYVQAGACLVGGISIGKQHFWTINSSYRCYIQTSQN